MNVYGAPEEIVKPDIGAYFGTGGLGHQAYQEAETAYIDAVAQWAVENGDKHALAGQYVSVPFADGSAQYVVAKFGGRVCLVHLDIMDGWRDGRFERTATIAELKRIIEARRARAELFARRT